MDTETRLNALEDRIAKLEDLAKTAMTQFELGMAKLESHPLFGSVIRMFKD